MLGTVLTGIDIGSDSIKFVQARKGKGGKLHLVNAGIASISETAAMPDGDARDESIAAVLRGLLADRRAKVRKAHTCVSGKKVITRYTHTPPMPPWRLEKVMAFEMQNEAPGGTEDVASDYKLLDLPNKGNEFTVLVGMSKEDAIQSQNNIFRSVGIGVEDITLGCLPTFNAFLHSKKAELESMNGPCAVVNIGSEKMELVILFGSKLYFARTLTPGGASFTDAIRQELRIPFANAENIKRQRGRLAGAGRHGESAPAESAGARGEVPVIPVLPEGASPDDEDTAYGSADDEKMIAQIAADGQAVPAAGAAENPITRVLDGAAHGLVNAIQSCLRYAKAQTKLQNLNVSRIYITGGGAVLPGLAERIQERVGIETHQFDPLENVDYSSLDPAGRDMLEANRLAFTTAFGLVESAFINDAIDMSLLPKSLKQRRTFMKTDIYGYAAAGMFAITVAGMIFNSHRATGKLRAFTQQQAAKITQAQNGEKELESLKVVNVDLAEKVGKLKELVGESRMHLAAIAVLKKLIPDEIEVQVLQNYMGSSPPAPRPTIGTKNRYGKAQELVKQPKILFLSGKVAEKVSPDRSREIVRDLVESAVTADDPFGRKVFKSAKVVRHMAENKRIFEIQFELNEDSDNETAGRQ
ncbi:MAG TPA: pilus assembly protein PilM [Planctomycetota bacterium]|nr:pilus assembly protein PilM [Planctomycetota bacterium]